MNALWNEYGLYLWLLSTALTLVALAWLAWTTFNQHDEGLEALKAEHAVQAQLLAELQTQVDELREGAPLMRATLGRSLQFCGLVRYADAAGGAAYALALLNARGEGVLIASSVRGGTLIKPLSDWNNPQLTAEERAAIEQARAGGLTHDQLPNATP